MRRIQIDINRRDRDGNTPAHYAGPAPLVGEAVVAFEPEDEVCAEAQVVSTDPARGVVVLDVDWDSLRDDTLEDGYVFWSFPAASSHGSYAVAS